jgi:hypothetical protein
MSDALDYKSIHNGKFDDLAYRSSFEPERGPKECVRALADLLPPGAEVFEYGVGLGANALFLAERGFSVEAQDVSDKMIARLREIMLERGVDFPVRDSVAHEHPHTWSYRAFVCTYVLHFMPPTDALGLIATIRERTLPGGYAAFEIFTAQSGDYVRPDRYYPERADFLGLFADWETVASHTWQKTGAQTGTTERLSALVRRPLWPEDILAGK